MSLPYILNRIGAAAAAVWLAVGTATANEARLTTSRHISTENGLSCNQVFDIAQDADGYIWMGTANGLCRYDGYHFLNFSLLGAARHGAVGYVIPDDDGRHLWVQTSTYVFACLDLLTGQFVDFTAKGDETRTYRKFIRGRQGCLWMYDDESGVRRVKGRADGTVSCTDYTAQNGLLPHSHVCDAVEDDSGQLWVMTLNGLAVIDAQGKARTIARGQNYRKGIAIGRQRLMLTDSNEVLVYDAEGRLQQRKAVPAEAGQIPVITASFDWQGRWVIMTRGGTFIVSPRDAIVRTAPAYRVESGTVMQSFGGTHFVSNASGTLWVFPAQGDMRRLDLMSGLNMTTERFRRYNIAQGADGLFYLASYGNGLYTYDVQTGALEHYTATTPWPLIGNNFLSNIWIDRGGCLWLSEESTGVSCILPPGALQARYWFPHPQQEGDWSNFVRMVTLTADGHAVFSTRDNWLHRLDLQTGAMTPQQQLPSTAYAQLRDSKGHQWTATRGAGLYLDGQRTELPAKHVYDIVEDRTGRLWVATWGEGLFVVTLQADGKLSWQQLMKRTYNESILRYMKDDGRGRLWIATNNGVYTIDMLKTDVSDQQLEYFNTQNGGLPFDEIISLCCSHDGYVWVGSRGSGLLKCRYEDGHFQTVQTFTTQEGMATNNVFSITEDRDGNIWAGTDNGLTRISSDGKVSAHQFGHTLKSNIYSENCGLQLSDGRLLFGTVNGLMTLSERKEESGERKAEPASPLITTVSINGNPQYQAADRHQLTLSHDQNSLVLSFSCLDYATLSATQYQYYLEGIDHSWLPLTSVNQAHYNGLRPGRYRFHLRALSEDNQWSEETTFDLRIRQPWYNTWWAWLIYLAVLGTVGYHFYRSWHRNFELRQQMKMEKELTAFQLNLFTHITHEFRTPLALISGATDRLVQTDNEGQPSRSAIQTVKRGTKRLLKLVNQLMEFRKLSTGNLKLNVEQLDIVALVRSVCQEFWDVAKQKELHMTFTPHARSHEATADRQIVETILYNLLSNAVKYTPAKGSIVVRLKADDRQLSISVEDSGPGISPQQEQRLFQPFMHGYVSQGGMGIGLHTAYQSALVHHGGLTYERVAKEGGSRFTLTLPATADSYSSDEYASATAVKEGEERSEADRARGETTIRELLPEAYNDYRVAVIEDDPDMRQQLCDSIGRYFQTTGYMDGQSALDGISQQQPDLIVCDIMLPDTNGYDLVRKVRNRQESADIPIIMLTALDDEDHLLRGYKAGADDYFVKPCNFELLMLRITQFIKWHHRLSETKEAGTGGQEPTLITDEADKRFKEKVEAIVARRMGEPDFTVDTLAAQLKTGRTKFYGKVKDLMGMSPNTYLQTQRLKKAAELLIEGELNVTEISYRVGFQNPNYFYKCFKEKYGVPPSKYGKK